jgi:membrane-associated PAP2 superfamily phosphatase
MPGALGPPSLTRSVMTESESTLAATPGASPRQPSWPAGTASLTFSVLSLFLFFLYSKTHWRVVFDHYREMSPGLRGAALHVLNGLEIYRVVAVVALVFAVWAFRGRPRWLAWVALPVSLLTIMTALLIQ